VVLRAGQSLLRASFNESNWDAATKVLGYISFLNTKVAPPIGDVTAPGQDFVISSDFYQPPSWKMNSIAWIGTSRPPDIPELRPIGGQDVNQKSPIASSYLLIKGGTLKLDGLFIKRAIFSNAHIEYDGGPLSLVGVYFINCTFTVAPKANGQLLAGKILSEDAKTTFSTS